MVTLSLILALGTKIAAQECTIDDQQFLNEELPRLTTWSSIYASYKANMPQCDDGMWAEGYSEVVVKMLSDRWGMVDELARLGRHDRHFRRFVLKHIDATTDPDDLRAVVKNANRRCPRDLRALCASLERAAKTALTLFEGTSRR